MTKLYPSLEIEELEADLNKKLFVERHHPVSIPKPFLRHLLRLRER